MSDIYHKLNSLYEEYKDFCLFFSECTVYKNALLIQYFSLLNLTNLYLSMFVVLYYTFRRYMGKMYKERLPILYYPILCLSTDESSEEKDVRCFVYV
jgi:hypothetical protein